MSVGFSSNNVLGGPLDPGVSRQLELRKNVISKTNSRSDQDIQYLTGTTGWVRVTSSVNVWDSEKRQFTPDLAKKYQLFGGTLGSRAGFNPTSENSAYTQSNEYGYIPTPGISSFQVKSQGTFGTLRTASFNFTVHSPEDFSILEQLYLRPGFTILLEWGHSLFLSNKDGGLETTVQPFSLDSYLGRLSSKSIENRIKQLKGSDENKLGHSYNYDAMFGFIKNFIWNYNGVNYECQVDVVSKGEVIESIRSTMAPLHELKNKTDNKDVEYSPSGFASEMECFLYALKHAPYDQLDALAPISTSGIGTTSTISYLRETNKTLTDKLMTTYSNIGKEFKIMVNNIGTANQKGDGYPRYITLRTLLILINEASLLYSNEEPLGQFYIGEKSKVSNFTTFFEHIGVNQQICILPKAKIQAIANMTSELFYDISTQAAFGTNELTDILNIFVSVDYLINVFEARKTNKNAANNTVYDVLVSDILLDIEKNLGNINEFDIHYDSDDSLFYIVDRKIVPAKNSITSFIDLVGLKTEVRNLNISSKLTNDLTSMIAIAAQDTYSPSSANDLYNIQKWNSGLKDRHLIKKKVGRKSETTDVDIEEIVSTSLKNQYLDYISTFNYKQRTYGPIRQPNTEQLQDMHNQLMSEYVRKYTTKKRTNPPGLIPFELSFTMKGIAGIKVGQAFKIPEFFLPERYRGVVAFIVTGIDHTVSNNDWTTEIKSQMFVV